MYGKQPGPGLQNSLNWFEQGTKKYWSFSDLGLDNQGPDLVDISQKIGHKRHRIGSPCEVPSAFNVFNHSPIQEPPRRASSLHYLINCHPLFLASEKRQYLLAAKGCVGKSVILHKIAYVATVSKAWYLGVPYFQVPNPHEQCSKQEMSSLTAWLIWFPVMGDVRIPKKPQRIITP